MLADRLRKNQRHLGRWARKQGLECYRVYHRDIPQWPVTVDRLGDWVYLRLPEKQRFSLDELNSEVCSALEVDLSSVWYRERGLESQEFQVNELGSQFILKLSQQRDTGLFLDHRISRRLVAQASRGKSLLNLFCYTGSFSVHAARQGAVRSLGVDLSGKHLRWAAQNYKLNQLGAEHELKKAEVGTWLDQQGPTSWDLVVLDPPTFSHSKSSEQDFEVQRDHAELIRKSVRLLRPGGQLFFSTNYRKFELDKGLWREFQVEELTAKTLPEDFKKSNIHQSFWIRRRVTRL